jgi:hypothetical protein
MSRSSIPLAPLLLAAALASCGGDPLTPRDKLLADSLGFSHEAVAIVKKECTDLTRFQGVDSVGMPKAGPGITAKTGNGNGLATVRKLEPLLAPLGYHVYWTAMNFGKGPDEVSIMNGGDGFSFIKLRGTSGTSYTIGTDSVIAKLKEWAPLYDLRIVGAGVDWVQADIGRPPRDVTAFAKEVYLFCPDIVDQGSTTIAALADDIRDSKTLFLWWD